jgi:hypothetical protein
MQVFYGAITFTRNNYRFSESGRRKQLRITPAAVANWRSEEKCCNEKRLMNAMIDVAQNVVPE